MLGAAEAASIGAPGGSAAGGVRTQPSQLHREGRGGEVHLMRTPLMRWMRREAGDKVSAGLAEQQ